MNGLEDKTAEEQSVNNTTSGFAALFDWIEALVSALFVVILVFVFVGRIIGVDGHSMEQTLHHHDSIIISNVGYTPKQGDIVVLTKESFLESPIVKRVIAVEGQVIDIDFEAGKVYVDNELMDEPYINELTHDYERMDFPLTVPEHSVFVMGDNRNESTDSRSPRLGTVDRRYILGHAVFRIFPFNRIGRIR